MSRARAPVRPSAEGWFAHWDVGLRRLGLQMHWMPVGQAQEVHWRGLAVSEDPEDHLITVK